MSLSLKGSAPCFILQASRKILEGRGCQSFEERNRMLLLRKVGLANSRATSPEGRFRIRARSL